MVTDQRLYLSRQLADKKKRTIAVAEGVTVGLIMANFHQLKRYEFFKGYYGLQPEQKHGN
jgi:hypothetical protein